MERLTKIIDGGVVFPRELLGVTLTPDDDYMHKLLTRLAAYEDAMTLERAQELAQAEMDGRLVVLPCKVGCTVYRVITPRDAAPVVTEIEIKTLGQASDLIGRIGKKQLLVSWYLTREEAAAALKKREADNEAD